MNNNSDKKLANKIINLLVKAVEMSSHAADYMGVYSFLRWLKRDKTLILMYHGVSKENITSLDNFDGKHVNRHLFERQLLYLRKHYNLISLDEYINLRGRGDKLPRNQVILTFDDGYKNNFTVLLPLMKRYKFPVTIYLPTKQTEDGIIPLDGAVAFILANTKKKNLDLVMGGQKQFYDLSSKKKRFGSIIEIKKRLKSFSGKEGESLLKQLIKKAGVNLPKKDDNLFLMSWEDIMDLYGSSRQYVSFGAHTHTHPYLTELSREEIKRELRLAKEMLEKKSGKTVLHLSYPYGAYNRHIIKESNNIGYSSAVTTDYGYNGKNTDIFRLKRIAVSNNNSMALFMLNLFVNSGKIAEKIVRSYIWLKKRLHCQN